MGPVVAVKSQAFPSPDAAIRAKAGPIPGNPNSPPALDKSALGKSVLVSLVFSQTGQEVGVMVLNAMDCQPMGVG